MKGEEKSFSIIFFYLYNSYKKVPDLEREFERYAKEFKFSRGIPEFVANKDKFKNSTLYDEKHSMTNSETIDPILEQVRFSCRSNAVLDPRLHNA